MFTAATETYWKNYILDMTIEHLGKSSIEVFLMVFCMFSNIGLKWYLNSSSVFWTDSSYSRC